MGGGKHIKNAQIAKNVWNTLPKEKQKKIRKYFHLRPTSTGVTIVSTLPIAPMRGINVSKESELQNNLEEIFNNYQTITSDDNDKAKDALAGLGFKKRDIGEGVLLEESFQAMMINMMNDENGKGYKIFKDSEPIKFLASELIFEKGPNRIDIVGYDDNSLYFFELKKKRTFKVEQVSNYVGYYENKRMVLDELLSNYPINALSVKDKKIKGVMVMRHAENSSNRKEWEQLEKQHNIRILFYNLSIDFKTPTESK